MVDSCERRCCGNGVTSGELPAGVEDHPTGSTSTHSSGSGSRQPSGLHPSTSETNNFASHDGLESDDHHNHLHSIHPTTTEPTENEATTIPICCDTSPTGCKCTDDCAVQFASFLCQQECKKKEKEDTRSLAGSWYVEEESSMDFGDDGHEHGDEHGHDHDHDHSHEHEHGHRHRKKHKHGHHHPDDHGHVHEHGHSHNKEHGHEQNHDHRHDGCGSHEHDHSHSADNHGAEQDLHSHKALEAHGAPNHPELIPNDENDNCQTNCCDSKGFDSAEDTCCEDGCDDDHTGGCCDEDDDCCGENDLKKVQLRATVIELHNGATDIPKELPAEYAKPIPDSINHHHHNLRYRGKSGTEPCKKHMDEALERGLASLSNTRKSSEAKPCFCRVIVDMASSSSVSLVKQCCELRKRKETVFQVCCDKIHAVASGVFQKLADAGASKESSIWQLVLSVGGMTCSGCSDKMEKVLKSIPGVDPLTVKANFLLNRAELCYDRDAIVDGSVTIRAIVRKKAGFKCDPLLEAKFEKGGLFAGKLVVRTTNGNIEDFKQGSYKGIGKVYARGEKHIDETELFCIEYDPQVIGARVILSNTGGTLDNGPGQHDESQQTMAQRYNRHYLRTPFIRMIFAAVFTIPVIVLAYAPLKDVENLTKLAIALPFATLVQMSAYSIYANAFRSILFQKELDMDVLVGMSTTAAYVYSVIAFGFEVNAKMNGVPSPLGDKEPLFETSTMLITLIFIGRFLTSWVRYNATKDEKSLDDLQKTVVHLKGQDEPMDARLLHYNDIIVADMHSEFLVTDGVIIDGEAEVDESMLTGEPHPLVRKRRSPVLAGSRIVKGRVEYRATRLIHENTISCLRKLVDDAAGSRSRTQDLADAIAKVLTPTVFAISMGIFVIWTLVGIYKLGRTPSDAAVVAITFSIATLAISCPCALGLAVPMVLVVGTSLGKKYGIIFKSLSLAEKSGKIKNVIFDKTGTLTSGVLKVHSHRFYVPEVEVSSLKDSIWCLTGKDRHPVSSAIAQFLSHEERGEKISNTGTVNSVIGKGLELTLPNGSTLRGGSPSWVSPTAPSDFFIQDSISSGRTIFAVSLNNTLVAAFALTDTLRPEVYHVLTSLRTRGLTPHLLSGDHHKAVLEVSNELGFDEEHVRSSCSPEDKATYITSLGSDSVLFIGDGSNDAPALSSAAVGAAMTHSTELASSAAQLGILSDNLYAIVIFLDLAKRMRRMMRVNFAWALTYNFVAVMFASGVFEEWDIRIEPQWAGVGEFASVAPVIVGGFAVGWWFKGGEKLEELMKESSEGGVTGRSGE